jgi:hypothetical protein
MQQREGWREGERAERPGAEKRGSVEKGVGGNEGAKGVRDPRLLVSVLREKVQRMMIQHATTRGQGTRSLVVPWLEARAAATIDLSRHKVDPCHQMVYKLPCVCTLVLSVCASPSAISILCLSRMKHTGAGGQEICLFQVVQWVNP